MGFCGRGKTENDRALSKTGTRKNCTVIVGILKEELPKNFRRQISDMEMLNISSHSLHLTFDNLNVEIDRLTKQIADSYAIE